MQKRYILVISICMVILFSGCGKKSPPTPMRLPVLGGINDFTGEVKDGVLFLSFSIPTKDKDGSDLRGLGGFKILKACGSCMGGLEPFKEIILNDNKGFTIVNGRLYVYDDDLMKGLLYSYKVYPVTMKGTMGASSNPFAITWEDTPSPPTNVSAQGDDERVEFKWSQEDGFTYNIYRFEDAIYPLFPVNQGPLSKPYFIDSGLENGKTYQYEIRKVTMKGGIKREGQGTKVEATPVDLTPPAVPRDIKAEKKGKGVQVTWKENIEKDLYGYNIYRVINGKADKLNDEEVFEPIFLDENLPEMRYVSYYVTAVDEADNESEPSRESIIILKE
ncbi:MAG: hypothetical protein C0392_02950 [Syntrophus sp. (in: bacteria)]|nr:hypothetical protein [Syntrophus sp. (in: bacteria)]